MTTISDTKFSSIIRKHGHFLLFMLALLVIIFVVAIPVVDNGVSVKYLLESFVGREPEWYGNYSNTDTYDGIILTYGYVSLIACPVLCFLTRYRNKIIFVLTVISLIHIFLSMINYPARFNEFDTTPAYYIACSLPVIMFILLCLMYFAKADSGKPANICQVLF